MEKKNQKPRVKAASKRTKKQVGKALDKRSQSLSYMNPNKMAQAITGYGYKPSAKSLFIWFFIYAVGTIGCGLILKMKWIYILIMILSGVLFMPGIIVRYFYNKKENQRFSDVNIYMEQVLYSFRVTNLVYPSICDMETQFSDGKMHDCIVKAKAYMESPKSDDPTPVETALKFIEDEYYCDKLITIHQFMCNAQKLGSNKYSSTTQMLLRDRSAWEKRQIQIQKDRKQKKLQVTLSIIVAILVCIIFTRMIPNELEIMSSAIVQIGTSVMWFMMIVLYCKADKKTSVNLLASIESHSEDVQLKRYNRIVTWDESKEVRSSAVWMCIIAAVTFVLYSVFQKQWMIIVGGMLIVVMMFQHKIDYRLTFKSLVDDIRLAFPRWMIEISLLLQAESVSAALLKSYDNAPGILKPELELLIKRRKESPDSAEPFIDFFGDFALKDVQSAMKMLYSIQAGSGGDSDAQISDIIERNNQMLEVTEREIADHAMASLETLFLMPLLIAGGKLMIDMMVFMLKSFTAFGSSV